MSDDAASGRGSRVSTADASQAESRANTAEGGASSKPTTAPPSARSSTSRSSSAKGKKGSKSKKKGKKKPIVEDPRLVRDLQTWAESGEAQSMTDIFESPEWDKRYDLLEGQAAECLMIAALKGHTDVIRTVISHGGMADINDGKALQRSCLKGIFSSVKVLLEHGADVNSRSTFYEHTPLHYASQKGDVEIIKYLLDKGAKIDDVSHNEHCGLNNGWAAIHFAADLGHLEVMQLLVDRGASIDLKTTQGDTALVLSAENGRWDVVRYLVGAGADIHAVRRGLNVVQWAVYRADEETVKFLVSYGAIADLMIMTEWFPPQTTLKDLIFKEFSEAVYDQIDMAIYRGGVIVKEREKRRKTMTEFSWQERQESVHDPLAMDAAPKKKSVLTRSLPPHIVNLIVAYDM